VFYIVGILFFLWVIFFNGAEKLTNTLVGYFEFGPAVDNPQYIRILSWVALIFIVISIIAE